MERSELPGAGTGARHLPFADLAVRAEMRRRGEQVDGGGCHGGVPSNPRSLHARRRPAVGHTKQHLTLRLPAPGDLADLAATVEEALRAYARQRTVLKKQWGPVNWHWTHSAPLHRL
ncbi:hypothetical protein LRE75_08970 [Streptomyces sp. 372A]